jgi:hypothetical protein
MGSALFCEDHSFPKACLTVTARGGLFTVIDTSAVLKALFWQINGRWNLKRGACGIITSL